MTRNIDLRSDTVTRPTAAMRRAMFEADVGDDVFGDDPTVNRLQEHAAHLFGFETALFFPSGTQANLAALMSHCQRGDEVIVGHESHIYRHEAGGAAVLASVYPQVIVNRADGSLDLAEVEAAIKPDDPHYARTRLLALENTFSGRVLDPAYLEQAVALARRRGLGVHLDGARIFNAAVSLKTRVEVLCAGFDSVSVCLSKSLGAPAGTVLVGGRGFVSEARRARKILGGAMRQAGVLAAAGLHALEHHIERLREDHERAERLALGLREIGMTAERHTNMVFVQVERTLLEALTKHLWQKGILVLPAPRMRLVTHLDVSDEDIVRTLAAFQSFARGA